MALTLVSQDVGVFFVWRNVLIHSTVCDEYRFIGYNLFVDQQQNAAVI
jgi:hypothetical protein